MKLPLRLLSVSSSCVLLASCGAISSLRNATASRVSQISKFSVTDLMPAEVGIAQVRPKDLKEMPLGKERALAFEAKKQSIASRQDRGSWFSKGPAEFKEPILPIDAGLLDGSLLPPLPN
jgi:hypothetical protein